ncbi:uncharacterized protein At4g02000-like [Rutidosis leptorrhynchoides]|uniref:uncharacterized protein At4g02000-like n=1 Tax=Rutidosis leptorrhynchoides TaxID=125765 RepID=UPI003A9A1DD4
MASDDPDESVRMIALCQRLGRLGSDQEVETWEDEPAIEKIAECGLYLAKFQQDKDFQRISQGGPWLFSSHLVNIKPWIPNTPLHCYDFTRCAFWVQILGLPLEWMTDQILRKAANQLWDILEVKVASKEGSTVKIGRVRVEINLGVPMKTGKLIRLAGKLLWLDLRYERLPHFCYSCGRLGYYATNCIDIPFDLAKEEGKDKLAFGPWLKAEVHQSSPY